MEEKIKKLISAGKEVEIEITNEQGKRLIEYMEKILEVNQQINLTRIVEEDEFIKLHLIDSLTVLKLIKNEETSILDVGTGGGFPGIPLAIMLEKTKITLMDSTNKKLKVVESIARELGIKNIEILHARAEEAGQNERYREKYDVVVSRALANLTLLLEYCLPLTKVGGRFLAMKGKDYLSELSEAEKPMKILGGKVNKIEKCLLLEDQGVHVILEINKKRETPKGFPRINGKIKKEKFPIYKEK